MFEFFRKRRELERARLAALPDAAERMDAKAILNDSIVFASPLEAFDYATQHCNERLGPDANVYAYVEREYTAVSPMVFDVLMAANGGTVVLQSTTSRQQESIAVMRDLGMEVRSRVQPVQQGDLVLMRYSALLAEKYESGAAGWYIAFRVVPIYNKTMQGFPPDVF